MGDNQQCHNYTIKQDEDCELPGNPDSLFKLRLALITTDDDALHISSHSEVTTVFIDDTAEPECCKLLY